MHFFISVVYLKTCVFPTQHSAMLEFS